MQQNQAPMIDDAQQIPFPPQPVKDPSPFFFKILITLILVLAAASIITPQTRLALSNFSHLIYFKGQIWRFFTPCLVTFSAIDCVFVIVCAYMSIATFEKRVGSVVFICDFILIGFLMNLICSIVFLVLNSFLERMPDQLEMKHTSGFFGMYFFYLSRFYFLNPQNDVPFFCFIIKQKNFPQVLFLILMAVTSFNVPIIISVSYLMVVIEEYYFKGRYFKFNFYFYLKLEKIFKWIYGRDDFYSMTECADSLSFLNNLDDLRRLYMEEERLVIEEIRGFMDRLGHERNQEAVGNNNNQQQQLNNNNNNNNNNNLGQQNRHRQQLNENNEENNGGSEQKTSTDNTLFSEVDSVHELKLDKNQDEYYV